ncbi:MAG: DinB family protein [Chloroflexi bacterium]|nr:DinB family protein [Chloroflexota bacterium]
MQTTTPATLPAIDLRRAPLADLRAIDFRDPARDFWADEALVWQRFRSTWAGLDDAAWHVPGAAPSDAGGPDWSLLEHVAHIEDWQELDVGYVARVLEGGDWPADDEYSGGDFDRFNESRRERFADLVPGQLRARLADSHARLVALAARLPLEVIRSDAAWGWVFDVLHGHVIDHLAVIEPWVVRLRARQDDGDPFVPDPRPATFDAFWADLDAALAQLEAVLEPVHDADWTSRDVTPGWTLRDHVGHLADWAAEGERAIAEFGRTGVWPADPAEGVDAWSQARIRAARGETPVAARARLASAFAGLRAATEGLSLAEVRDAEGWSWVYDCLQGHVRKHLAHLGPWAVELAWEREHQAPQRAGASA